MERFSVIANGTVVLQGDQIGRQGFTGRVVPCCLPPYTAENPECAPGEHLHFQWDQTRPAKVNGDTTSPLAGSTSTNSNIGYLAIDPAGMTLRNYYINSSGWGSRGWTHDHCPGPCTTLGVISNFTWGIMQDFRHHPDILGGQFNTIHVANWNTGQAFLVDSFFWAAWAADGLTFNGGRRPIGMALTERGGCPSLASGACTFYQKFHQGYVWMNASAVRSAVFCPDVYLLDNLHKVTFADFGVLAPAYGSNPFSPKWNARVDFNGNSLVNFDDFAIFAYEYAKKCYPT